MVGIWEELDSIKPIAGFLESFFIGLGPLKGIYLRVFFSRCVFSYRSSLLPLVSARKMPMSSPGI
jgi:hypothetical protein